MSSLAWSEAVLAARRRFSSGNSVPEDVLSPPILRSWMRCAERGLPMHAQPKVEPLSAGQLSVERERHEQLRRRCRPEVEALHADAKSTDSIVILTDPSGLVLDTVGSLDFADRAARVALQPGFNWSEATIGTNAIGTALVEKRPVEVRGAEHYSDPHAFLTCSASPIIGPEGDLLGLLDLSGPASVAHLHALALVQLAVDHIEHRMFDSTAFTGRDIVRFHLDPSFLGTAREGVLVFEDHRLVAANRHGLRMLDLGWDDLAQRRYGELFEGALARTTEERKVRRARGDTVVMRVDRAEPRTHVVRRPAAEAAKPPASPATGATAQPHYNTDTASSLTRAVRLLDAQVPVLIQGETGTGKEVFAREMHRLSARTARPFAAVNCAALPEGLIESELFGYEEGAFTGARRAGFKGVLREADGGVLFLDEIGDMPLSLQTRLLRVLQEREVTPLGGGRPVPVDFTLICASHRDLTRLVENGAFRADLYFRIAQYTVTLPALRTLADREALVRDFWAGMAGGADAPTLSPQCVALLAAYHWPGNFRQFVGTLKVLLALAEPGGLLTEDALPAEITMRRAVAPDAPATSLTDAAILEAGDLGAVTRAAMQAALEACEGNVSKAARRLGIHRSTLYRQVLGDKVPGKAR